MTTPHMWQPSPSTPLAPSATPATHPPPPLGAPSPDPPAPPTRNPRQQAGALPAIAQVLVAAGRTHPAAQTVRTIPDALDQAVALAAVAESLTNSSSQLIGRG